MNEAVTLSCDHRFCGGCLTDELTYKITNAMTQEDMLICPLDKKPIDFSIIQHLLN
jgi:hypothetical protein